MENCSSLKRNKILAHATTWTYFGNLMLSEKKASHKKKLHKAQLGKSVEAGSMWLGSQGLEREFFFFLDSGRE